MRSYISASKSISNNSKHISKYINSKHSSNKHSSSNSNSSSNSKKDNLLQLLVNIGTICLIIIIIVIIYKYFIVTDYQRLRTEGFVDLPNTNTINTNTTSTNTIYEQSINSLYGSNTRLKCGMLPNIYNQYNVCRFNNESFIPYKFPIHMIKLVDSSILAVFNDGRLYSKVNITSNLWSGPITNSLPQDIIPLRMITLSTDLVTLLGVGFDNILYIKKPDTNGNINLTIPWKQVPNNSEIIYVLFDNQTNFLLSIDINGNLFTKKSFDNTSTNQQLNINLDRPILRLYYDLNGYMLAIDEEFDLFQFTDLNWKISSFNMILGPNSRKIQDLLYDNDGKMYGLIFNPDTFMVQIMKQTSVFYLSGFIEINKQLNNQISSTVSDTTNFVMSDQDIIKCKTGSLREYAELTNINEMNDDDVEYAAQKQGIENLKKLRTFCANRNITTNNINYENYDLLASVDKNKNKISNLKNIVTNLLTYEQDSTQIKEKYPIIA